MRIVPRTKAIGFCLSLFLLASDKSLFADCVGGLDGSPIRLKIKSCQMIDGGTNKEVLDNAGPLYKDWNLKDAYTGALIKDSNGSLWMLPSKKENLCDNYPANQTYWFRGWTVCCDTGRWGKCVFGGNFLREANDKRAINNFQ